MTASQEKSAYLLDANILFGFSLWMPIDLNKNFWDKLEESLRNGDWILLDVVVAEIAYDNDGLKKWCDAQKKHGLVVTIGDDIKNRAVEINNTYKMIDETTQKSAVDTYLVAYAEKHQMIVFSREALRIDNTKPYKIPDVCNALKIQWIRRPKRFLGAIGFKN